MAKGQPDPRQRWSISKLRDDLERLKKIRGPQRSASISGACVCVVSTRRLPAVAEGLFGVSKKKGFKRIALYRWKGMRFACVGFLTGSDAFGVWETY